eukprot:UN12626
MVDMSQLLGLMSQSVAITLGRTNLDQLLEIAKYAPSGGNLQPWTVYLMDKKQKDKPILTFSTHMVFSIDKQMEIGQYADLGMFIQNIKLLCGEYGLSSSKIHFLNSSLNSQKIRDLFSIPTHEIIFCIMEIRTGINFNNTRNYDQKLSKIKFILSPKL